jgi:TatA/E family protein of Tat protein translocase
MPNIGPLEIIIVLVIVLIIFGPKRLPDLGRSLGRGMREFKDSVTGKDKDEELPSAPPPEEAAWTIWTSCARASCSRCSPSGSRSP